ncbi:SAM-dependent methyltransferase [Paenibacillus sp. GSMTC-2017]|uniref:SAM-dependent methyltransferase n=1 Tax=Paenibacillus sp. GSMTC-2017 TaxID=2794350 RepID=UPI0018D9F6BD|nr:SAM-dependent methyltransferase [Paenibacillus sp. GSMTC-2017]MBH5317571.1 SAM-dependent methyltransferase [Paenibacillus sp. GSMTC-2017]
MSEQSKQRFRFSEAPIWDLQRAYYEEQGMNAWNNDGVPQYITSNPMIATAYAEMIFGFLQDRSGSGQNTEPVTIVELGAGAGRLAFHILNKLCELIDYAGIPFPPFRYVMTDLAESNIVAWKNHLSLQPFIEQGILDFAIFDAVNDSELKLVVSNETIQQGDLKQPLLIVANYFFDSIPQDLIYVGDGNIFECDVVIDYANNQSLLNPAEALKQLSLTYEYRRAPEYEDDTYPYSELITLYVQELEDSHILFPSVGLTCLERLNKLSHEGFVLITADKGDHRLDNWKFAEPPEIIHHGSISLTANYHAIEFVIKQKGGEALFTQHHYKNLNVGCMFMSESSSSYINTKLAYKRFIDRFGPDDFFSLKEWVDQHSETMEPRQLLAFWRLGGYDSEFFIHNITSISSHALDVSDEEKLDIQLGIHKMWNSYYQIEQQHTLAQQVGLLLFELDLFVDAKQFLEISVATEEGAKTSDILYSLAICCYELELEDALLDYLKQVLVLEPHHEEALQLIDSLRDEV